MVLLTLEPAVVQPARVSSLIQCVYRYVVPNTKVYMNNIVPTVLCNNLMFCFLEALLFIFDFNSLEICLAGTQLDADTNDCVECPRGYYKEGSQRFGPCQACEDGKANYTTIGTGAQSLDECTICKAFYLGFNI